MVAVMVDILGFSSVWDDSEGRISRFFDAYEYGMKGRHEMKRDFRLSGMKMKTL